MTFVESVKTVFSKYADFNGCAGLSEYWWFMLFSIAGQFVLGLASSWLALIFSLAILVPSIAVGVRRLHDTDRSGWLLLLALIPLVGWIIVIVFTVQDSKPNRYGTTGTAVA